MLYHNDITFKTLRVSEALSFIFGHLGWESTGHKWIQLTNEPALRRFDVFFVVRQHIVKQTVELPDIWHALQFMSCHWNDTAIYWIMTKHSLPVIQFKTHSGPFLCQSWVNPQGAVMGGHKNVMCSVAGPKSSHIYILCYFYGSTLDEMGYLLQGRLTVAAIGSTHQVANDITKAFHEIINPLGVGDEHTTQWISLDEVMALPHYHYWWLNEDWSLAYNLVNFE